VISKYDFFGRLLFQLYQLQKWRYCGERELHFDATVQRVTEEYQKEMGRGTVREFSYRPSER